MAERLTRNNKVNFYFHDEASNMVYYKLQNLEDIMAKYGIESAKELDVRLDKTMLEWKNEVDKDFKDMIKSDRDTWKRACELMGEELDMYATKEDNTISTAQYFYQQVKKEGNNNETD